MYQVSSKSAGYNVYTKRSPNYSNASRSREHHGPPADSSTILRVPAAPLASYWGADGSLVCPRTVQYAPKNLVIDRHVYDGSDPEQEAARRAFSGKFYKLTEGEMSKLDPDGGWTDGMMAKVDGHARKVDVETVVPPPSRQKQLSGAEKPMQSHGHDGSRSDSMTDRYPDHFYTQNGQKLIRDRPRLDDLRRDRDRYDGVDREHGSGVRLISHVTYLNTAEPETYDDERFTQRRSRTISEAPSDHGRRSSYQDPRPSSRAVDSRDYDRGPEYHRPDPGREPSRPQRVRTSRGIETQPHRRETWDPPSTRYRQPLRRHGYDD